MSGTPSVRTPARRYMNLEDVGPVQVESSITQITGGVTLLLQTAANAEGPWFDGQEYAAVTRATVVMDSSPFGADISQVQRLVRWELRAPASTWSITFRINVDLSPYAHETVSAGVAAKLFQVSDGMHEFEPWFSARGGISLGTPETENNALIQREGNWLKTESIENLVLESQTLMMSGVTLVIESAMSKEGPWTSVATITSNAYAVTTHLLTKMPGGDAPLRRWVRWHLGGDGATTNWQACFRINASWSR